MPAHPASNVKWNGDYVFGNETLINMPDHGSLVAAVIAGWSITETHLGRIFAAMIGARQPVAMSMYGAVRSFEVQRALLEAAVDEILPKRYALLFRAALVVLNRAAQHRNRFAHWVWGVSADPELRALLLVEPRHFWNLTASQIRYWKFRSNTRIAKEGPTNFMAGVPKLAHENIFVYRLKDLQEARTQVERAFRISGALLELVVLKGPRRQAIYRWLASESDIRLALQNMKNDPRPKKPPAPAPQRKSAPKAQG